MVRSLTQLVLLLSAACVGACVPRTVPAVRVLDHTPPENDLITGHFAPAAGILSGFDARASDGQWRIGDRLLFGMEIEANKEHLVRFVLFELRSGVLPTGAPIEILPPGQPPPAGAMHVVYPPGVRPPEAASAPAAQPGAVEAAGAAAPSSPAPADNRVFVLLDKTDDPALAGRLPPRTWSMAMTFRDQQGRQLELTRDSGAALIAVYLYDAEGQRLKSSCVLAPAAYLRGGLFAACELAGRDKSKQFLDDKDSLSASADVLPSLMGFGQTIADTPCLRDVVRTIVPTPSLWSILLHGGRVDCSASANMDDVAPESRMLLPSRAGSRTYQLPMSVSLNGEPALSCSLSIMPPDPPLHLCAGVVAVDGVQTKDVSHRFSARVLAARRFPHP